MSQNARPKQINVITAGALINMLSELAPEARCFPVVFWDESGSYRYIRDVRICQAEGCRGLDEPVNATSMSVLGLF